MTGLSADRPSEVVLAARVARQFYLEGISKVGIADRLEVTEVHARPEGDTCLAAIALADWKEVARVRNPSGPDDSADFSYVTYMRRRSH